MTLPNFLIIGAAKSGTTSLYHYLEQHPQVYVNIKEPSFFALEGQKLSYAGPGDQDGFVRRAITDLESYEAVFAGLTNELAWGEASVLYLYSPTAPDRIKHYVPDVKLIAILRNPIERAFSSFMHLRRDGREPLTNFSEALEAEEARIKANWEHQWHYREMGRYYTQLKRYYTRFPQEHIAVYTYEDFKDKPLGVLQSIFQFLGVDDGFVPDMSVKHNVSGLPQSRMLHTFLVEPNIIKDVVRPLFPLGLRRQLGTRLRGWNTNTRKPEILLETRRELERFYANEIRNLEKLLGRDLSQWLNIKL